MLSPDQLSDSSRQLGIVLGQYAVNPGGWVEIVPARRPQEEGPASASTPTAAGSQSTVDPSLVR